MVVGQVQSGKTANYTGLICKAADAGYRLIVVLAGIHNSLRSQTQLRLDEGFLGFDTQQRAILRADATAGSASGGSPVRELLAGQLAHEQRGAGRLQPEGRATGRDAASARIPSSSS